jgi:predicted MFS family arabinose efflux permease
MVASGMGELEVHTEKEHVEGTERYRFLRFLSYFLFAIGPLVGNAVLALLGAIATDFVVDPTAILIAIPAFMFPFALFQLLSGAISDIYGRVRVMLLGLVAFAVGLLVTAYAASLEILVLGNVLSGVGFAFVNPVVLALLSDLSAPEDIPRRMGIASALASLSAGLGPFLAGQLISFGWQSYYLLFFIIVIITLLAMSVADRPVRKPQGDSEIRMFIVNLTIELRRPLVLLTLGTTFLVALVYLGALVWTARALTGALDENLIGVILLAGGVAGAAAGSLLGPMIRRWGFELPIVLGLLSNFTGLSIFIVAGDITLASTIPLVGLALAAVGWAGGLLFPMTITFGQMISPTRRGVLAGAVTSSFFLGSALILSLYEPLFEIGISAVYAGMLVVSVVLLLFFYILYRTLKSMYHETMIGHGSSAPSFER